MNKIDSTDCPYLILEDDRKNYIQCAGNKQELTVEVRIYSEDSFKHFVLGRKEQSKVWASITNKVGPIDVLMHEVLNINDAAILFEEFYKNGSISNMFSKRNVSKYFSS